jgi:hypothetical protein
MNSILSSVYEARASLPRGISDNTIRASVGKTLASKFKDTSKQIQPRVERGCEPVAFHSTSPRAHTVSNAQPHDVYEALGNPP